MSELVQRRKATLAEWITALGTVATAIAVAAAFLQIDASVRQAQTNAAISFINIHNNEGFYASRAQLITALIDIRSRFSQNQTFTNQGLSEEDLNSIASDYSVAEKLSRGADSSLSTPKSMPEDNKSSGLALILLYDAVAKCMEEQICDFDSTNHHFQNITSIVLSSFRKQIVDEWRPSGFTDLGLHACQLAEGKITEGSRIYASFLESFSGQKEANNSLGCDLLGKNKIF